MFRAKLEPHVQKFLENSTEKHAEKPKKKVGKLADKPPTALSLALVKNEEFDMDSKKGKKIRLSLKSPRRDSSNDRTRLGSVNKKKLPMHFRDILSDKSISESFTQFLQEKDNANDLKFFVEVKEFSEKIYKSPEEILHTVNSIIQQFALNNREKTSLSKETREKMSEEIPLQTAKEESQPPSPSSSAHPYANLVNQYKIIFDPLVAAVSSTLQIQYMTWCTIKN